MRLGFEVNAKAEDEGVWTPVELPGQPKLEILLRSNRSPAFRRLQDLRISTDPRLKKRGAKARRAAEVLMRELHAEHVIVDWRGLLDAETGEEVAYTPELARRLMTERDFELFADAVIVAAGRVGRPEDVPDLDDDDENDAAEDPEEALPGPSAP